ncbi:unnamed protein product [Rotaria socialis]
MRLVEEKCISMGILLASNLIMTLIGICLQRVLRERNVNFLSTTQHIISCLTSGILLGTLLMMILPDSLELFAHRWHTMSMGYLFIGLGFFLICIIQDLFNLYELYAFKRQVSSEKEEILNSSKESNHDNRITRLIALVFALGTHNFFDGIIIGGQTKDAMTLWLVVAAICFHMSLIAFSVTLRLLVDNETYIRVFCAMFIWSLMGPLGVLASLLITSESSGFSLFNGTLQCFSAGTFLYITFIDMIHSDLMKKTFYPFANIFFDGHVGILLIKKIKNRTEPAAPPAPSRAPPAATGGAGSKKSDNAAFSPWDLAQIWIESVSKEETTRKQWEQTHGWIADYDPKGNIKPKKPPVENSTRFSDKVPNSHGHDYGWRLQSNVGQEIQSLQTRFGDQHKKRVSKEVLGYD